MRRWLWCAVLAVSIAARAQEGHAPHAAEPASSEHAVRGRTRRRSTPPPTSSSTLRSSPEVGFQVPLSDKEFVIHFPVWRIPLKAGACPADPETPASLGSGCLDITLTKHTFWMLVGSVIVVLLFTFGANRNPNQPVPHGPRQNVLEMLVLFVRNEIAIPNIGKEEGPRYVPYLLSVFFFILTLNLLGLVPWMSTATGNLGGHAGARPLHLRAHPDREHPRGGVRRLPEAPDRRGAAVDLADHGPGRDPGPLHQALRSDAPALRQHARGAHRALLPAGADLHPRAPRWSRSWRCRSRIFIYLLELFVAFLQAYIFAMLSALFIGMGVAMGHHDEHPHEEHGKTHDTGHGKTEPAMTPANAPG